MQFVKRVIVFSFISLAILVSSADRSLILADDEDRAEWNPTTPEQLTVNVDEGYTIQVNITHCNLMGDNGDFVQISNDVDPLYADQYTEIIFSYLCVTNMSYFYNSTKIIAQYKATSPSSIFKAIFKRAGEGIPLTTTELPTSTVYLPTPSERDQAEITVYVYGAKPEIFSNNSESLTSLKVALADMAIKYTSVNNFPLNGSISMNNVVIQNLEQCHVTWEEYDTCIELTFSVPINLLKTNKDNTRWDGYQMDEQNLRLMWETYAPNYISKANVQLYPVPNIDGIIKLRLIVSATIVLAFAVTMLVTLKIAMKRKKKNQKNQLSEQMSIADTSSQRPSEVSMTEHYLQETPPWENEPPVFPNQGYHNLSFEPDDQEEENISPDQRQDDTLDLVDLNGSETEM